MTQVVGEFLSDAQRRFSADDPAANLNRFSLHSSSDTMERCNLKSDIVIRQK